MRHRALRQKFELILAGGLRPAPAPPGHPERRAGPHTNRYIHGGLTLRPVLLLRMSVPGMIGAISRSAAEMDSEEIDDLLGSGV